MKTLPLAEVKANFSQLIDQVVKRDEQILITRKRPARSSPGQRGRIRQPVRDGRDPLGSGANGRNPAGPARAEAGIQDLYAGGATP
jgi:antitoxin (DNA-binding transcriptional repressor) of toxin-antitoxin stability system